LDRVKGVRRKAIDAAAAYNLTSIGVWFKK